MNYLLYTIAIIIGGIFSLRDVVQEALPETHTYSEQKVDCKRAALTSIVKYKIARKTRTNDGGLFLHISVRAQDFDPAKRETLACQLASDWAAESKVFVSIFDRFDAAKKYVYPWEQEKPAKWQKYEVSLRANYLRDLNKHEHWIAWYPDPLHKEGKTVVTLEN